MSQTGYNYTSSNHIKATAAVLETPRGHDTRKVLLMHTDHTPNALSAQPETRLIPLTQGKFAIVDAADYEWLTQWKWHAHNSRGIFYAARKSRHSDGRRCVIMMHRAILGVPSDIKVDHIDGDGLRNTRKNIRPCFHGENMRNSRKRRNNTSGYKGVFWDKRRRKWQAQIRVNGKNRSFGLHDNAVDAARAYDSAARELHREFARLNFEDER